MTDFYQEFGLKHVINASGKMTILASRRCHRRQLRRSNSATRTSLRWPP